MTRSKFGVFSLSTSSPDGNDARYLEWHALDHMPQQFEIPGVLFAQRWVSTPECRAARAMQTERFEPVNHVVHYLFSEPVAPTVDEFFELRDHLIRIGRFPERLPSVLVAGCDVTGTHAAERAAVTGEVVPWRPNRGVYLVVERARERGEVVRWSADAIDELLALDGVAGVWTFTPGDLRPDEFSRAGYGVAVCYLDEDPLRVAEPIAKVLDARWEREPVDPGLAAPLVTVRPWEWHLHAKPGG
jgi:hypothetical protein